MSSPLENFLENVATAVVHWVRGVAYKLGFRPKPGAVLYSPSRAIALSTATALEDMREEFARQAAWQARNELTSALSRIYMDPPEGMTAEERETVGQAADVIGGSL